MKTLKTSNSQNTLKKEKAEGIRLLIFKLYYKSTAIKGAFLLW